jgi:predicted flavoprotein YhiN
VDRVEPVFDVAVIRGGDAGLFCASEAVPSTSNGIVGVRIRSRQYAQQSIPGVDMPRA